MSEGYVDEAESLAKIDKGIVFKEEPPEQGVLARYPGVSAKRFTDEQKAVLEQKIPPDEIDILPTGELYVSQVRYRRILNDAFGPGGWGLIPTGDFQQDGGTLCREYSLFAEGRFVASAIGEADFQPNNPRYSKATAAESLKSNALTRCCKDLLVASECWDKRYCKDWIGKYAVAVWCVGKAGDIAGKKKKLWRRRDADRFEYPWMEEGGPPPERSPSPPEDVPAIDIRSDRPPLRGVVGGDSRPSEVPPTPTPDQAEIVAPAASQTPKKDYPFLREAKRQKERLVQTFGEDVGRKLYYQVLGGAGYEHADQIQDRETKKAVFRDWQSMNTDAHPELLGAVVQP